MNVDEHDYLARSKKDDNLTANKTQHGAPGATSNKFLTRLRNNPWRLMFYVIFLTSFFTRFWGIALPKHVCWDETHFGKFVNHYINGQFFFDVHPPFGKMLLAVSGILTGYDGTFEFKEPGQAFPDDMSYAGMRYFAATFGALIAPLVYGIMFDCGFSLEASALSAFLVIFDTGINTLCRYILLDSILLFFITLSVFCYCRFRKYSNRPFSRIWWKWMYLTGIALACAFGTKWVGAFVILFIGVSTIIELWDILGDLSLSLKTVNKHFWARVICLIIVPAVVYTSFFWVHFMWVSNSGPGDGFMSSRFQTGLSGNVLNDAQCPKNIALGSKFSLKSYRLSGGLLHSHPDTYPEEFGPPQQQVTTYMHKDQNNMWIMKGVDDTWKQTRESNDEQNLLRHGDYVRFEHIHTKRNLHSHDAKAPITDGHKQVTCYGTNGNGDANDIWRVLIDGMDEPKEGETGPLIQILTTVLRIQHKNQHCQLHQGGVNLPKWGWEQGEVTCNPDQNDPNNLWNLEFIEDDKLESYNLGSKFRPSFWSNLIELHVVMANVNNNLLPKANEQVSRPWHWPILRQGQHFTPWNDDSHRVFLIGNPIIWFSNLAFIIIFCFTFLINMILDQRGYRNPLFKGRKQKLQKVGGWILFGYFLHYLPFFLMNRVLYFHHYFPALIFSFILTGIVVDELIFWIWYAGSKGGYSRKFIHLGMGLILFLLFCSFLYFAPFTYGMKTPKTEFGYLKWRKLWNLT